MKSPEQKHMEADIRSGLTVGQSVLESLSQSVLRIMQRQLDCNLRAPLEMNAHLTQGPHVAPEAQTPRPRSR